MKLAKNWSNVKQHHEVELFLSGNYLFFSSTLSSKRNGIYCKTGAEKRVSVLIKFYDWL